MKKFFTFFVLAFAFFFTQTTEGKVTKLVPGNNVYSTFVNAANGDTIELSEVGEYPWTTTQNLSVTTPKSITLRAADGLTTRPVIKVKSSVGAIAFMLFYNAGTASGTLRFEGIEFDGNRLLGSLVAVKCSAGYNLDIFMDNCYVHDLYHSTLTVIPFTYSNNLPLPGGNPNPDSLVIKNSIFDVTAAGVIYSSGVGRPKNVVVDNSWFKGSYSKGVFSNVIGADNTVKSYVFNHCTFDGNNTVDLNVNNIDGDPTSTTTISNCVFTGNTGTSTNNLGTGGNYKDHCGVYFTGTPNTVYKDNLMDATTLKTDPLIDSQGKATAPEYLNAGSDGKTIGFNPVRFLINTGLSKTAVKTDLSVFVKGNQLTVKGLNGNTSYKIFDISGKMVNSGLLDNGSATISRLSKGIYILKINEEPVKFLIH